MGLVNLRKAKLLLLSVSAERLKELQGIGSQLGYKGMDAVDSVPTTIATLKGGKTDVLIVDTDLGGTPFPDFAKAIRQAFPKVKILPVTHEPGKAANSVSFPIQKDALGRAVDQLMMEKMGIAASTVTVKDEF